MKLREWLHFFNIDRHMWIVIDEKLSDGKVEHRRSWSSTSIGELILSPLGLRDIVQAQITEKGNLWILIK